jgi:hypothetical protein
MKSYTNISKSNKELHILASKYRNMILCLFYFEFRGAESKTGPLGTSDTNGLLYLSRVIVGMENLVE